MKEQDKRKIKKGDEILLIKSYHSLNRYENQILLVTDNSPQGNLKVKSKEQPESGIWTLYMDDDFILATREEKIKYHYRKLEELKIEVEIVQEELDFLEKYESQEEFVAEKIKALIEADSTANMVEILRTLKQSNLL